MCQNNLKKVFRCYVFYFRLTSESLMTRRVFYYVVIAAAVFFTNICKMGKFQWAFVSVTTEHILVIAN